MPIFGLTVGDQGEVIQRLAVRTKVSIGQVVKTASGKTRPDKIDHFVFLRKNHTTFEWEPDPDLTKHYGAECRQFPIVLLDDDIETVFRTQLAWWKATERQCWGDGKDATRRTAYHPDGEDWHPCGDECPDLGAKRCKPSGDLHFMLAEFPRLGAVCRLHTTSYQSIRQLHSALDQIRTMLGGRLNGICCSLVVRPEKAAYMDGGVKKTTTFYALNIELEAAGMRKMLGMATQYAQLFTQTQNLLGTGRHVEYDEDPENVLAAEIVEEFPPADAKPAVQQPQRASAQPAAAAQTAGATQLTQALPATGKWSMAAPAANIPVDNGGGVITPQQRKKFFDLCVEAGWATGEVSKMLRQRFGLDTSSQIPAERFEEICLFFKAGGQAPMFNASDEDLPEQMR